MALCLGRLGYFHELSMFGSKTMRALVTVPIQRHKFVTSATALRSTSPSNEINQENTEVTDEQKQLPSKEKISHTHFPSGSQADSSGPDLNLRFRYPEMFPEPFMIYRNPLKEKLERKDMLARRSQIFIPEFYVGSVLKVTLSNFHQPDKTSDFVGICIQREECGLKAWFILRNIIDNLGVEVKLELYDPRLLKFEVLRLEKRLDTHLRYLRDAPPEYSTFPHDMKAEIRRSDEVFINPIKVKMNPRPWTENWFKYDFKGIDNIDELTTNQMKSMRDNLRKPWEKFDLMKTYRETLPEDEIKDILSEIQDDVEEHESKHKRRLT